MNYATFAMRRKDIGIDDVVVTVSSEETGDAQSAVVSWGAFNEMAAPILRKTHHILYVADADMKTIIIEWVPPDGVMVSVPNGNQQVRMLLDAAQYRQLTEALLLNLPKAMSDEFRRAAEWAKPLSI